MYVNLSRIEIMERIHLLRIKSLQSGAVALLTGEKSLNLTENQTDQRNNNSANQNCLRTCQPKKIDEMLRISCKTTVNPQEILTKKQDMIQRKWKNHWESWIIKFASGEANYNQSFRN